MKASQPHPLKSERGRFHLGGVAVVVIASAALHGVALQLPWPFQSTPDPPKPAIRDSAKPEIIDFTILPSGTLDSLLPEAPVENAVEVNADKPPQETNHSPLEVDTAFQDSAPASTQEPAPEETPPESLEPATQATLEPPVSPDAPASDSPEDLPVEEGIGTTPATGPTLPAEPPSPPEPPLEERLNDPAFYVFNNQPAANLAFLGSWLGNPSAPMPDEYDLNGTLKLPYGLGSHCLKTPPQNSAVNIMLDAAGNPLYPPELNGSTGYDDLDAQALSLAEAITTAPGFHEMGKVIVYALQIELEGYPDSCQ